MTEPPTQTTTCPKCSSIPRPSYCKGVSSIVLQPDQPDRPACERKGEHLHWICFCGYLFETDCKDVKKDGNK